MESGAANFTELELIDKLKAPNLVSARLILAGEFANYEEYLYAKRVGATQRKDLDHIERFAAPDLQTAKEIQKGNFGDFKTYARAKSV